MENYFQICLKEAYKQCQKTGKRDIKIEASNCINDEMVVVAFVRIYFDFEREEAILYCYKNKKEYIYKYAR